MRKTAQISVRVTADEMREIRRFAATHRLRPSEYVRQALARARERDAPTERDPKLLHKIISLIRRSDEASVARP
jgi:hypothetical protein